VAFLPFPHPFSAGDTILVDPESPFEEQHVVAAVGITLGIGPTLTVDGTLTSNFASGIKVTTTNLCAIDEFVLVHACTPCPAGTARAAGDPAQSGDTSCTPVLCGTDEFVLNHVCTDCPAGTTNTGGSDDASLADTPFSCVATLCAENERVADNVCVGCSASVASQHWLMKKGCNADGDADTDAGYANDDEALGYVQCCATTGGACERTDSANVCFTDKSAELTTGDGLKSFAEAEAICTAQSMQLCTREELVESTSSGCCSSGCDLDENAVWTSTSNEATGGVNLAGNDASSFDTFCQCLENEFVSSGLCLACLVDTTNVAGDQLDGGDTVCISTRTGKGGKKAKSAHSHSDHGHDHSASSSSKAGKGKGKGKGEGKGTKHPGKTQHPSTINLAAASAAQTSSASGSFLGIDSRAFGAWFGAGALLMVVAAVVGVSIDTASRHAVRRWNMAHGHDLPPACTSIREAETYSRL
jgi:hypothetical protein